MFQSVSVYFLLAYRTVPLSVLSIAATFRYIASIQGFLHFCKPIFFKVGMPHSGPNGLAARILMCLLIGTFPARKIHSFALDFTAEWPATSISFGKYFFFTHCHRLFLCRVVLPIAITSRRWLCPHGRSSFACVMTEMLHNLVWCFRWDKSIPPA